MNGFLNFLQYHNAIPILFGVLFLSTSAAFAATNPEVLYSQQQKVISIDNTYIANKDLSSYTPQVQITNIVEDAENYYVSYTLTTIDVEDSMWRDVTKDAMMTVAKDVLGKYGDLGLYVIEQLNQNLSHEVDRLKEVQAIEQRQVTKKTVATIYGGLVGKMMDEKTETFPEYTPVVTPPPPRPEPGQLAAARSAKSVPVVEVGTATIQQELPALSQAQIEQMIRDQVNAILAQRDNSGSQNNSTESDPKESEASSPEPPHESPSDELVEPVIPSDAEVPAGTDVESDSGAPATEDLESESSEPELSESSQVSSSPSDLSVPLNSAE